MEFRTHTGEIVSGERLADAIEAVADWYRDHAVAVRREDAYPACVSEDRREAIMWQGLAFAERVRGGDVRSFSVWQRVNAELTGECVALLS